MLNWLTSQTRRLARSIKEMATFWTSIGVMLIPVGIAVLIQWPTQYLVAFGLIFVGVILGTVGLGFTIRDERKANKKDEEERRRQKQEDVRNQQEHNEIIAILAGAKMPGGISTPRILRLIKRIRETEIEMKENERDPEDSHL